MDLAPIKNSPVILVAAELRKIGVGEGDPGERQQRKKK
jgi:hypothetical protein